MPLQRVRFSGELFPRTVENDSEWNTKSHVGESPIATVNFEILGEVEPQAVTSNSELRDLPAHKSLIHEYIWNIGLTGSELGWLEDLMSMMQCWCKLF